MPCSQHLANPLLNRLFRNQAWSTKPSTLYFGLLNSPPTNTVAGTGHTEVTLSSATGYGRVAVSVTHTNNTTFQVGTGSGGNGVETNRLTNSQEITWSQSASNWGQVTHLGVFSAASGGNLLMWFDLPAGGTQVAANTRFRIEQYKLDLGFDNAVVGDVLALKWLNWIFRNTMPAAPTALKLALCTSTTPTTITEVSSTNGYARVSVTSSSFGPAVAGVSTNIAVLGFPNSIGAWNGGSAIDSFALVDQLVSGGPDVYLHGPLTESVVVGTSSVAPNWPASSLNFALVG